MRYRQPQRCTRRPAIASLAARGLLLACGASWLAGCASVASSAAADLAGKLSAAIVDQDDPQLVREALPAYLLVLDSLAAGPDASPAVLDAATRLYAAWAVLFLGDGPRAQLAAERARDYGQRSVCTATKAGCELASLRYDELAARLSQLDAGSGESLFSYALGSLAFIRTHDSDLAALADLPRVELCLKRLLEIGPGPLLGSVNGYLGVLNTLRPPALGGQPETGRGYFEQAIALTGGRDLGIKVDFARGYARLVYDRKLHDRLLQEVIATDARQPGLTMLNHLAVEQARALLATADDYF